MPLVDPFSGQPDAKATPAAITPVPLSQRGFVLRPRPGGLAERNLVVRARPSRAAPPPCLRPRRPAADVAAWTALLFPDTDVIEYADGADGIYRGAAFRDADFVGCVFVGPAAARPQFEAVRTLLRDAGGGAIIDRRLVVSGQGLDGVAAAGPTVCACFSVGLAAIQAAIASGGAHARGDRTGAQGGNQLRIVRPRAQEDHRP